MEDMYVAEMKAVPEWSAAEHATTTALEAARMAELPCESLVESFIEVQDIVSSDQSKQASDIATEATT